MTDQVPGLTAEQKAKLTRKREMIYALTEKCGGVFKLSALLQKRVRDLVNGSQPLIDGAYGLSPLDVAFLEIDADYVTLQFTPEGDEGPKVVAKEDAGETAE